MRFVGRGDEHIRATHAKTLELSPDTTITTRATCVIAVGTRAEPLRPMAGAVRLELTVGDETFTVHARANSSWEPGGPAVIRRSALRLPGTFATHADAASSDLPRSLVAAMQDPDAVVEVTVDAEPSERRTVVLFAADSSRPADARLRAELAAADTVVAGDADARRLIGNHDARAEPRRTLVVACRELPGASVRAELAGADTSVETVGLPAQLAAAAASPSGGPIVLASADADARELLRTTPAGQRLVLATAADRLPALLALAAEIRGFAGATIAQEYAPPIRVRAGGSVELAGRDTVHCCFDAANDGGATLDPAVRAAVEHLLADGVPTRTAARALAELTGWPRRQAYDAVLGLGRDA